MKAVILAGGKGTRISPIADDIPKGMIKINNKPILEYEIECLKKQGIREIILTVGHLGGDIIDYFRDGSGISPVTKKPFDVKIEYYYENRPLGSAGALFKIKDKLTEDFLLINGDLIFDVDLQKFISFHKDHGGIVTLFTHPNNHPYDSALIVADKNAAVQKWISKSDNRACYYRNRVNAGIHILSPQIFNMNINFFKIDLDQHILKPLADSGKMFCYDSPEYVKDMGTPDRFISVSNDLSSGLVHRKNLNNKQKAIFLDRDGTINKYEKFLIDINKFELIDGVSQAIKKINTLGYLVIVVTNQPVIARGELDIEELEEIHNKMETLLGDEGAYIDRIYYCPHHPDGGYEGERKELKKNCWCRKPKPGLLLEAAQDFNIDLSQSWMVGDSLRDIEAGRRAGCKTALIGENLFGQDVSISSLLEFSILLDNM